MSGRSRSTFGSLQADKRTGRGLFAATTMRVTHYHAHRWTTPVGVHAVFVKTSHTAFLKQPLTRCNQSQLAQTHSFILLLYHTMAVGYWPGLVALDTFRLCSALKCYPAKAKVRLACCVADVAEQRRSHPRPLSILAVSFSFHFNLLRDPLTSNTADNSVHIWYGHDDTWESCLAL